MVRTHRQERRHRLALVERLGAAGTEPAAAGPGARRRHAAADRGEPPDRPRDTRNRGEQPLGVRVRGTGEQALGRGLLHDLAGVHHRHPVRPSRDDAEVVGDEQHRHAVALAQPVEHLEDLRLHGDVQRRGRLVRHQDLRLGRRARSRSSPAAACRRSADGDRRRAWPPGRGCPPPGAASSARRRASARETSKCARTPSAIWSPTVNTGLRLVIGSWKTIPIRRPRIRRSASPSSARTSVSPSRIVLPSSMRPGERHQAQQGEAGQALPASRFADQRERLARDRA